MYITGIEKYANQLMETGIEKIAVEVIYQYRKKDDKARKKNELTKGVRISLNKIANRIDHGFNHEVRVAPVPQQMEIDKASEELQKAIAVIQTSTSNMQFMKLEGQPIPRLPEAADKPKKKECDSNKGLLTYLSTRRGVAKLKGWILGNRRKVKNIKTAEQGG
ncbi:MAG: hypothetical protein HZA01_15745 [Nitrospinae bacterium]|nr:hypothetical protein [Nitrospinota bacterium]